MNKLASIAPYCVGIGIVGLVLTAGVWGLAKANTRMATQAERPTTTSADLFSDPSGLTTFGSEQPYVILDKQALFDQDGKTYLDKSYLASKKIYPLQLRTVSVSGQMAAAGFGVLTVLGLLLRRKPAR